MKKILILITLVLFSASALSNPDQLNPEDLEILCITEFPTTSFIGHSKNQKMTLRFVNSNGIQYMPISSSLITSHDLKVLAARAEALKNLPEEIEFPLDLKKCIVYADQTFFCHGGNAQFQDQLGEIVTVEAVYSSQIKTQFQNNQYDQVQVSISFRIKDESYTVSMNYSPFECGISYR